MTISAGDIVFVAKSQIGLKGAERYGGKPGEAWCAYFLHWCAVRAGAKKDVIPCLPWCDDLRDYYRKKGKWRTRDERKPRIGDIICFGWDSDTDHIHHVGLVCAVDQKYVYTIEGNSGAQRAVCEWKYPLKSPYILGYCRPKYEGEAEEKSTDEIKTVHMGTFTEAPTVAEYRPGKLTTVSPQKGEITLVIQTGETTFLPRVLSGVRLNLQSRGAPGTLTFEVLPGGHAFHEGSRVFAMTGETVLFCGYVFTKSRDMDGVIRVTAYDQLRYFKNKEFLVYERKRASDLLQKICKDHALTVGEIETTPVVIGKRFEDCVTLFDAMEHALHATFLGCGVRYILMDEGGKISLRAPWECGVKITPDRVRAMKYTSGIDRMINRINAITVEENVRKITVVEDPHSIGRFGLLSDVEKQSERDINAVRALLKEKNKVHRRLQLTTDGDTRVRAGCLIEIDLTLGDMVLSGLLTVSSVTHVWERGDHTMELVLEGGDFDA